MRFLLNTNILSDLVRHPHGRIRDRIKDVGQQNICTSIVVAAELRYGAAKKDSSRLTMQLEAVLHAIDVLALDQPADAVYGAPLRPRAAAAGFLPRSWRKLAILGLSRGADTSTTNLAAWLKSLGRLGGIGAIEIVLLD